MGAESSVALCDTEHRIFRAGVGLRYLVRGLGGRLILTSYTAELVHLSQATTEQEPTCLARLDASATKPWSEAPLPRLMTTARGHDMVMKNPALLP